MRLENNRLDLYYKFNIIYNLKVMDITYLAPIFQNNIPLQDKKRTNHA